MSKDMEVGVIDHTFPMTCEDIEVTKIIFVRATILDISECLKLNKGSLCPD